MSGATWAPAAPQAQRAAGLHAVGRDDAAAERWADSVAERLAPALSAGAPWSYAAVPVHAPPPVEDAVMASPSPGARDAAASAVNVALPGTGRPLDPALAAAVGHTLHTDLSGVRLHDDAPAAGTLARAGANALAVGSDVAAVPGHLDHHTTDGRRALVHELAHVAHTARTPGRAVVRRQSTGTQPAAAPATSLTGLADADRRRLQVVTTTPFTVPGLKAKFDKGTTINPAAAVALDPSVPVALGHGLSNVAAELSNGSLKPPPLAPNTTVTLDLDLTPFGGSAGLYRFTYTAPPAAKAAAPGKAAPAAAPAARILVEALGAAAAPPGTVPPQPVKPGEQPPPDPVAQKMTKAGLVSLLATSDEPALRAAVAQLPESHLALVSGLKVRRRPDSEAPEPDVAGHYDPTTHTVTMFDRAFASTQVVTVNPGAVGGATKTSYTSRAIVHEIGHAIDLAPLRAAYSTEAAADAAVADLPRRFPHPDDPTRWQWKGKEQKAEVDTVLAAQKAARKATLASKSRSGTSVAETTPGGKTTEVIGTGAGSNAYRVAATKDGPTAVSRYGEKDWQESYAEAYSLYVTAPDTLRALRPGTYDYFTKNLP